MAVLTLIQSPNIYRLTGNDRIFFVSVAFCCILIPEIRTPLFPSSGQCPRIWVEPIDGHVQVTYATNCATSAHCFFRVLHCIQSLSLCNKKTFQVYSAMNCWVLREIRSRRIVQDHSDMLECNMCQTFTSILGRFQIGPSTLLLPDAAECGTQFKPAACIHSICPRLKHMRKCR